MTLIGQDICVIGAGIGGLATARALALRGAAVTVLEQAPEIAEVGAGLQISPNGFRVIEALGLGGALRAQAVRAEAVSLRDYKMDREVLRLDLGRLPQEQGYFFVHRADLIALLADAAQEAGVTVRLNARVEAVDAGPQPALRLEGGETLRPGLLVGADGLHSKVRGAILGTIAPFFTRQVAWRAVIPNETGLEPMARLHMGPKRHVVSYPLRGGALINIVAVQERTEWAAEGWEHSDDPGALRAAFDDFGAEVTGMLAQVRQTRLWGLFRHPVAERWYDGRAALLGDAAHPTLPFLAQGANMALEDAWVLADALAGTQDLAAGLEVYQDRRRARVQRVVDAASKSAWKYHLTFPPLRLAAHLALAAGGRLVPGRMLGQFDWLYGHDVTRGN